MVDAEEMWEAAEALSPALEEWSREIDGELKRRPLPSLFPTEWAVLDRLCAVNRRKPRGFRHGTVIWQTLSSENLIDGNGVPTRWGYVAVRRWLAQGGK